MLGYKTLSSSKIRITSNLEEIGYFISHQKGFFIVDKENENWKKQVTKLLNTYISHGDTVGNIKSENKRFVIFDLEYDYIDSIHDSLDEVFYRLVNYNTFY